ncbi:serine hydrolase [Maricaulis sp. W15]|uniref:serine hydrolase domain-containing protein n=1 Tax=Maricaulis sp. W15 TaxID=1772333 RepID=UPI0009490436|nr:serine hydrolase domain-containing protein [Maricaulis sp. W15]OLF78031.1 serine hydrolase [Maricaulis sp. W15]
MTHILTIALAAGLAACSANTGSTPAVMAHDHAVDAIAREWVEAHDFNGVIMSSAPGHPAYQLVVGVADPDTARPLTADTAFQTGSVEKYFAAIVVFALMDEGVLDIDTPISAYLPDYRSDTGDQLTLRHILSNQSGLPNDILQAFRRAANGEMEAVEAIRVPDAVSLYASGDLGFEPGAQFDYVLSNWLLVQHLLEEVTGLPYPQLRARFVFDPAQMRQSGGYLNDLFNTDPRVDDVAIGFDPGDPAGQGDYWSPSFFRGSYTTAADMIALERALADGRVLSAARLELFRTVQAPQQAYAFGGRYRDWELCGEPRPVSTQSGSNGASNMTSAFDIQSGYAVAIMTNVDESQGEMFALSARLMETMMGCGE